jgi:hypothetical protein
MSWLSKLFGTESRAPSGTPSAHRTKRLRLEALEDRLVPTVTYHGGAVLPHVEVQGLYLGSDWYYNKTYFNQTGQLDAYLRFIVNSGYMDMLTNAGYGVGRGSATGGRIDLTSFNKNYYLLDSTIRADLQRDINGGGLATPDANRLYVVFVEPGVAIMNDHDHNTTSIRNFYGYHGAFAGGDGHGHAADIHYAVIAYPGGYNPTVPGLNALQDITEVTSHELAEGVTDPNVNYKTLGWYDNQRGEIGDIVNGQWIVYHGYIVQKEANKNDQGMVPPDYNGRSIADSALSADLVASLAQSLGKPKQPADAVFSSFAGAL